MRFQLNLDCTSTGVAEAHPARDNRAGNAFELALDMPPAAPAFRKRKRCRRL